MITTEYRPHKRPYEAPHIFNCGTGVVKVKVLDLDRPVKVTATIIATVVHVIVVTVGFWLAAKTGRYQFVNSFGIVVAASVSYLLTLRSIWMYLSADYVIPESRGIGDEIKDVRDTYQRLREMRALIPEGSGWIERIDEYGRIAYGLFKEIDRLPVATAKHTAAYRAKNEIQVEMQKLINSGNELVDLIATSRTENTKQAISHLGIDAYAEHVSLATAAFRALGPGESAKTSDLDVGGTPVNAPASVQARKYAGKDHPIYDEDHPVVRVIGEKR